MKKKTYFIDTEVNVSNKKIMDFGAVSYDGKAFHSANSVEFSKFINEAEYIVGHNIIHHDLHYCGQYLPNNGYKIVDTLFLSPLLFPKKPYHKLLKDDKITHEEENNPFLDAVKAKELLIDEIRAFKNLDESLKFIYYSLLKNIPEFTGFFELISFDNYSDSEQVELIKSRFYGMICEHVDLKSLIKSFPVELAYCLSTIQTQDSSSILSSWVYRTYPNVETVMTLLCGLDCKEGCSYCNEHFDVNKALKSYFGFDEFRLYKGEPLQKRAVEAAVKGKSLVAIFPTGGGKSLTFQLPALMAAKNTKALTVVISPLQSLMKDQVDGLENKGIEEAVTINGLLDPIERANSLERVRDGRASILYISPESLRSSTIENVLMNRTIDRFVIDEAHCFSAWGQDFRVDYLYIAPFLKDLQERKGLRKPIPVSCFTATAKKKVVSDIIDYFRKGLGIEMEIYSTNATRENLSYSVQFKESDEDKYETVRRLLDERKCPTIIYCCRVATTKSLAERLVSDGYKARAYNGKMTAEDKITNQDSFINDEVQIIVATSAFGMGVDKSDVGLVIHYEISDSIENYIQEAGRAGRNQKIQAECIILFNEKDLDKHFKLLNNSKLTQNEINQVWTAIKNLTKNRTVINRSPLEIARSAGWNDEVKDIETRVKTAISALENAGYIERGRNHPRVFADGLLIKNYIEANKAIDSSREIETVNKECSKRIIKALISKNSISQAGNTEAESRIDYIADNLGLTSQKVIDCVTQMRNAGILDDSKDLTVYVKGRELSKTASDIIEKMAIIESYLLDCFKEQEIIINYKELNDKAINSGLEFSSIKRIKTIINFWCICGKASKNRSTNSNLVRLQFNVTQQQLKEDLQRRKDISGCILDFLSTNLEFKKKINDEVLVEFSELDVMNYCNGEGSLVHLSKEAKYKEIEYVLLYLSRIEAIRIDGGFLVLYNTLSIRRKEIKSNKRYTKDDYSQLNEYYCQKIQQIHIVGEYAKIMASNPQEALQFVQDYFELDSKAFIAKYFKGNRAGEINVNITPSTFKKYFDGLSSVQREIIDDKSPYITVIAGPGSGKTKVLVHKLASLLLLEDIKQEQLLMLTFSRAAATEFKTRLIDLIGDSAYYVDIKTFHSYCFDLLGRIGSVSQSSEVVSVATEKIINGEIEPAKIVKSVLVIDEAQDMDQAEYNLVQALINQNEQLRVIAVGDDDQNIYEFRGSNSKYLKELSEKNEAKQYELLTNYRSDSNIVDFTNIFARRIRDRLKKNDVSSNSKNKGIVSINKLTTDNIGMAVVDRILKSEKGNIAVLTSTNNLALQIDGVLRNAGVRCRLIEDQMDIVVYNLVEIRQFLKYIEKNEEMPIISKDIWEKCKQKTLIQYSQSDNCSLLKAILDIFEKNNKKYYKTDLLEYLKESMVSDFVEADKDTVIVSTYHKAKGREFDKVYVIVDKDYRLDEQAKRALYVAMTRAKHQLVIYTNGQLFDEFKNNRMVEYSEDAMVYPEPEEMIVELGYHDIFLGTVKNRKKQILSLMAGQAIQYNEGKFFVDEINGEVELFALSKKAKERMDEIFKQGFQLKYSRINYIIAWQDKNDVASREYAIILPYLCFSKKKDDKLQFYV